MSVSLVCAVLETMIVSWSTNITFVFFHWTVSFPAAIFIGFEFASYTYEEQEATIPDPFSPEQQLQEIYLVKSIESEQTFDIVVRATASGEQPATFDVDYHTGVGGSQQTVEFRFHQDRLLFPLRLFHDDIPEPTETFQLISLHIHGGVPFNPSANATCTVFILDNDSKCYWYVCTLTI